MESVVFTPVKGAASLFYLSGLAGSESESGLVKTTIPITATTTPTTTNTTTAYGGDADGPSWSTTRWTAKYSSASDIYGRSFVVQRAWQPTQDQVRDGMRLVALLDQDRRRDLVAFR